MASNGWDDNNLPNNAAFISILSPEEEYGEEHYFKENHDNVINIRCSDIDYYFYKAGGITYCGLSDEQAEELFNFIDRNQDKDFYIHCSAGISRSQGVVRFILDYYDNFEENPNNPCLTPNSHITKLLTRCWINKYWTFHDNIE